jgi:uncharacterized phosphosugar-binding protein
MLTKFIVILACLTMTVGVSLAQEISGDALEESVETKREDQIFWSQQVDGSQEWGIWLKEVFKPYSDELGKAILKIITSTKEIDPTGKSSAQMMEEVTAAYTRSLMSMEMIKPPVELKAYHLKVVELYRQTINADPSEAAQNAVVIKQISREADQALTKAFQLHGIPERVIYRFTK